MSQPQEKPDRGDGPAPNVKGDAQSEVIPRFDKGWGKPGWWTREPRSSLRGPGGLVFRFYQSHHLIRLSHPTMRDGRVEVLVELGYGFQTPALVVGRCDDLLALGAFQPFADEVAGSSISWTYGLRTIFYAAVLEWFDGLRTDQPAS